MIMLPPTDAMGNSSLFFVLAFLGRRKIGSASALSGFSLENFLRGRTKQHRQHLTITPSVGCVAICCQIWLRGWLLV